MGDACGSLQFTYVSLDDYRIVLSQLQGRRKKTFKTEKRSVFGVYFTFIFKGWAQRERGAEKGYNIKITKLPASAVPKAQVLKQTSGLRKAVIDADTDKILGAVLFCEES